MGYTARQGTRDDLHRARKPQREGLAASESCAVRSPASCLSEGMATQAENLGEKPKVLEKMA